MPLSPAHIAAILPLARPLAGGAALSGLVIGSMIPDVAHFLPFHAKGRVASWSHSPIGLLIFCLPLGTIVTLAFDAWMRAPLGELLPDPLRRRISDSALPARLPSRQHCLQVMVGVLVGAATHLLWDAFTHSDGFFVRHWALLRREFFVLGGYHVWGFKVVQHASTVLGLLAVAFYVNRRCSSTTSTLAGWQPRLAEAHRRGIRRLLVGAVLVSGGWAATLGMGEAVGRGAPWAQVLRVGAGRAVIATGWGVAGVLGGYLVLWYGLHWRPPGVGGSGSPAPPRLERTPRR